MNPVLLTIGLFISISIASTTPRRLEYQTLLQTQTLSKPTQLDISTDEHSFELFSIDHFRSVNDPTLTLVSLLSLRLQRDLLRAKALSYARAAGKSISGPVVSGYDMGYSTYFVRMGVGTPPKDFYMSLDTGSDIIWLQCSPCTRCYNQSDPIFNPLRSRTFSPVACRDPRCKQLQPYFYGCGGRHNNTCLYHVLYSDHSFTKGAFSTETMTLGRTALKNIALGCGHDNGGGFYASAGLLGLGRGNLSFATQTGGREFSYCFAFWFSSNKSSIVFGPSAATRKAAFTPLINKNATTYYYVNLTGVSVGGARVPGITSSVFDLKPNGDGGVIMDSGTEITRLVKKAYIALRDTFRAKARELNPALELSSAVNYSPFDTCYNISSVSFDVKIPTVELHFEGGADMKLSADNTVILMDSNGTYCFAFLPSDWYTTIGNFQQQSFRIVYDTPGSRVGFVAHGC